MEGVLERAVANGADNLLRQVKHVMPEVPMLTGAPEVRGFRLDGYGVFFDVEVPALRLPLAWTLRYVVDGNRLAVNAALAQLRALVLEQPAQERERLETLVRQMEQRGLPTSASARGRSRRRARPQRSLHALGEGGARGRHAREQRPAEPGVRRVADGRGARQRAGGPAGARRHHGGQDGDLPRSRAAIWRRSDPAR